MSLCHSITSGVLGLETSKQKVTSAIGTVGMRLEAVPVWLRIVVEEKSCEEAVPVWLRIVVEEKSCEEAEELAEP